MVASVGRKQVVREYNAKYNKHKWFFQVEVYLNGC